MKEKLKRIRQYVMNALDMDSRNFQFFLNIVLIIVINIAAAAFSVRIDLTANGNYSLSHRSRETVSGLNEKLKIKVFFSRDLPAEHSMVFRYLRDILEQYDFYGNRNFSYEIIDEDKLEVQARDYGIRPVQSRELSSDQVKVRSVYMGIAIQHADLIEKIDALTTTVGLEYEITSRIEKMTGKIDRLLKLDKPVMVTLYLDERIKELPIEGIGNLEAGVSGAVSRSGLRNYNRLKFRVVDPSKDGGRELDSLYGISKLRWPAMKTRSGRMIAAGEGFFGMVMEARDKTVRINLDVAPTILGTNVITGLQNLEDTLNAGVGDLLSTGPGIGYVKGHGIPDIDDKKNNDGAGLFGEILSDIYQVEQIDLKTQDIPPGLKVLIINGPTDPFSDQEKYKIDQFLMQGKSVLYFVNSFIEMNQGGQQNFMGNQPLILPVNTGLEEMAAHYGIKINKNVVLDRNCARVNMLTDYPLMPLIGKKSLNRKNVITRHINSALFIKTSSLDVDEKLKDKGVETATLVSTSPDSWLMEGRMNFSPLFMTPPSGKEMKSYTVAALISGRFESYYKGKDMPSADDVKNRKSTLSAVKKLDSTVGSGKSELIVVGSSELTISGFLNYARRVLSGTGAGEVFSNDILLHSMVDYLAGNTYIPEMKSKSLDYNPLVKTGDRTRFILKIINMVFVPVLVVLAGIAVWKKRIMRKKIIESEFSGEK
jgi:ABC-type uncharacterized transport system involved in gliding motility auxiliary subunit